MGIKTKFNPLGGRASISSEKGMIYLAEYISSNMITNGSGVVNMSSITTIPRKNVEYSIMGHYSVDRTYNDKTYTSTDTYNFGYSTANSIYHSVRRMTPFYNLATPAGAGAKTVDLAGIPAAEHAAGGSMYTWTFGHCNLLTSVSNFSNDTTTLYITFRDCLNFNQNISIPNTVVNLNGTFRNCTKLNQNILIPKNIVSTHGMFIGCTAMKQCAILSTEVEDMYHMFTNTTVAKNVYMYFKYANGTLTKTYNTAIQAYADGGINGFNGVTIRNLGLAPW